MKKLIVKPTYDINKFFVNYGSTLSLALIFIVFNFDLIGNYLPRFSSSLLTAITYALIAMIPNFLGIYYKNKKKIKLKAIGKAARLGPFLEKKPDSQAYFLSHYYFERNKETKQLEKLKHSVVFNATEKELEILYNKFYDACGALEKTTIKIRETIFEIENTMDIKGFSAIVKVRKNGNKRGYFKLHQNQIDMLFGKREFNPIYLD
tara:strand:- start:4 stop:621 length:618 start_codon:yes stop_codon:yes gene_type:complete